MFNNKKIEELEDNIKVNNISLQRRIEDLTDLLSEAGIKWVDNYFKDCPCCMGEPEKILLSKAKEFKKKENRSSFYTYYETIETFYTTPKSYELHKKKIDEWEKETKSKNA